MVLAHGRRYHMLGVQRFRDGGAPLFECRSAWARRMGTHKPAAVAAMWAASPAMLSSQLIRSLWAEKAAVSMDLNARQNAGHDPACGDAAEHDCDDNFPRGNGRAASEMGGPHDLVVSSHYTANCHEQRRRKPRRIAEQRNRGGRFRRSGPAGARLPATPVPGSADSGVNAARMFLDWP